MGLPHVSLVTPTSDRPAAIELCARWVRRFDYPGRVEWVVVDDGVESVENLVPWLERYVRVPPLPSVSGARSLARNLLAGLACAVGDVVVVIEDDEWYDYRHVDQIVAALEAGADAAGCSFQRYYHAGKRRWAEFQNIGSCLSQTGLRRSLVPWLAECAARSWESGAKGIDYAFWQRVLKSGGDAVPALYGSPRHVVGVKGLPGKPGIGVGHDPRFDRYQPDPDLEVLRAWIGDDADLYSGYADG